MNGEQSCFVLADPEACVGCRACEVACVAAHTPGQPKTVGALRTPLMPNLFLTRTERGCMPVQCHQCENAPCLRSCATGALERAGGAVVINRKKCIGCKNCVMACPFGAIALLGAEDLARLRGVFGPTGIPQDQGFPRFIYKCDRCIGRDAGPACVAACPRDALRVVDAAAEVKDKRLKATAALEGVSDGLSLRRA
ncbi:MAG: 4Fe-4S dicluster domain-containing protein [Spirochaetaceae bacterium]|jgi:electron transport protein HydN|nr:4Fe-4S dicluster domain-containing protein [Spirochaetaceae bacterium]